MSDTTATVTPTPPKVATVFRTRVPLKTAEGNPVPPKTRVVVMSTQRVTEQNKGQKPTIKVKIVDPAQPTLTGQWFCAAEGAFTATQRGRPKKGE